MTAQTSKQAFIGGGAVLTSILTSIAARAAGKVAGRVIDEVEERVIGREVEREISTDPVVRNEINAEHPARSRVANGAVMSIVGAIGIIFVQGSACGWELACYNVEQLWPAIVVVSGAALTLYGRFKGGSKPLYSWLLD